MSEKTSIEAIGDFFFFFSFISLNIKHVVVAKSQNEKRYRDMIICRLKVNCEYNEYSV